MSARRDACTRRRRRARDRGAWLLALLWLLPLAYAFWTAFHPAAYRDALRACPRR